MACKVDLLEDNKYQGVVLMLFLFITFIVFGNIVCFYQCHLISLIDNGLKDGNIRVYTNFELRTIRSQMNRSPRIFVLEPETVNCYM